MQDRTSLLIFPALLLIFLAGCAAQPTTLMLQPLSRRVIYAQKFGQAYAGQDDDSSPAFLLVSDDAAATSSKHGAQLQPADLPPLRQVVYIKVLWRPMDGTHNHAANASIDWYILSDTVESAANLLEYQGLGSVTFDPGDNTTTVNIRSANLRPTVSRGTLRDPIGPCKLTGTFTAINDNTRMRSLLSATRKRAGALADD